MSSTPTQVRPAPTEVLIREARQRQRARHRRLGVVLVALVVLAGSLLLLMGAPWSSAGPSRPATAPASAHGAPAAVPAVLVRPVLCVAPPATADSVGSGPLPASCPPPYADTVGGNGVTPSVTGPVGYTVNPQRIDPALGGLATSRQDSPSQVVLLGQRGDPVGARYLLAPAVLQLSRRDVTSVTVRRAPGGTSMVAVTLTGRAAAAWDQAAQRSFHEFLAIDLGGGVVSAPIVEPAQSSFTSLGGSLVVSGGLVRGATVQSLVHALR